MRGGFWTSSLLTVLMFVSPLLSAADRDWLAAREAFRQGNDTALAQAARDLRGSPLAVYADYWQVWRLARLAEGNAAVADFLQREQGSYLAEQLRIHWLTQLAQRQDWARVRAEAPKLLGTPATELQCWLLQADLAFDDVSKATPLAETLWLTSRDQPNSCTPVINALFDRGILTQEHRWQRFRLALEDGVSGVARFVGNGLGLSLAERDIKALTDTPRQVIERADVSQRGARELAAFAYSRWARVDPVGAHAHLEANAGRLREQAAYAWRGLAMAAVRRFDPIAESFFQRSETAAWTTVHRETRLRGLVRHGAWADYRRVYDTLPVAIQNQRAWQYWLARAQDEANLKANAQRIFAQLSVDEDFYGLLSLERLGAVMAAPSTNVVINRADRDRLAAHPGFQRAFALHALGQRWESAAEWNWAVRFANDDRLLLAAAEAANQREWYDRAIFAAERTQQLHEPRFRYLTPYRDVTRGYARELGLDEAWVYGLIRQESRFVSSARSSAGAGGLMQVMPATAQWVTKRLGIPYQASMTNDVGQNVRLGTYYLQHVLSSLGHPVLATAGYNAGPRRAQEWRPDQNLEAARFIESIPFYETRDYVKKVMTNAVHYARIFNDGERVLSRRIGVVPGYLTAQSSLESSP
ncbi:MAG: transglycosylase SLT domain-containing protein [Moraxellaceae bacterium]|nr:transglycosylase SLT domain-containing protein [Moraxellaceae bacterium]MDZ4386870.1 transglycosylase SLT domain-containing protein [Moraxellaceae bacterium]